MKKTKQTRKTIFNIPSDEAKIYLNSITNDVYIIKKSEKFIEASKKVNLPQDATIKDYEKLIKHTIPSKIYNFLLLFFDDCFDNVRRILSAVFVTDFEEYRKKSLEEMCQDIASLQVNEIYRLFSFFIHSGR